MPNTIRRTLTLLNFTDGVYVVESKKPLDQSLHHPGTAYSSEAKFSLLGLFKEQTPVYDPKQKAERAIREVFYLLDRDDLETKPHFKSDGVEWHPVVARMDLYQFRSDLLEYKKKKSDWKVTALDEHRFADNLRKLLPT